MTRKRGRAVTRQRGGKGTTPQSQQRKRRAWVSGMPTREEAERQRRAVAAIMAEPDPRKRREMEQHLAIKEMVRLAEIDGERQAREAHEMGKRAPSETIGPSELLDILMRERKDV